MYEIDIRENNDREITSIRFGEGDTEVVTRVFSGLEIQDDTGGSVLIENEDDLDNLMAALEKAKELKWVEE